MGQITDEAIRAIFSGAADFSGRAIRCGDHTLYIYMIDGLVAAGSASEYVIKPISLTLHAQRMEELYRKALSGGVYNAVAAECSDTKDVAKMLVNGFCVVLFPGVGAIAYEVKTPEKRSVSPPTVESSVKGAKDAFTETVRTNTSLLRRHLRTPDLRLMECTVGRESLTNVTLCWVEGITPPEYVKRLKGRLDEIHADGLLTPVSVEELVTHARATPFPLLQYTERADKFASGLLSGQVGLLVDGLPLGYLLPVDLGRLMTSPEDYSVDHVSASCIRILRLGALLMSLLLPGFYIALACFHQEMIPLPLLRSIIDSRRDVPFSVVSEVLGLLIAFEFLQEAGLHLPKSVGQSVSIIGGIVVGSAAVEAGLISPAALIVVSLSGICGFSLPNRDFAQAARLFRFAFAALGAFAGLFGVTAGFLAMLIHLAGLTSLDVPYLMPFSDGSAKELLRHPAGREDP